MDGSEAETRCRLDKVYPRYSVLIPVYCKDHFDWFDFAIDSMINQTVPPGEIVIVQDGPITEQIEAVIHKKMENGTVPIRCVKLLQNQGLGKALNAGVQECQYDWIVRMDADDYSCPSRCEKQFNAIIEHHADIVGCDINEFIGGPANVVARRVFPEQHVDIYRFAKRRTPFAHPGVVMRKSHVLQACNYRSAFLHEDFDLFVRLLRMGCKGYTVKEPLVSMRISDDFYSRRGGVKYLKALLRFNVEAWKSDWMSFSDFAVRSSANIASCILPNSLRDKLYKKMLRK